MSLSANRPDYDPSTIPPSNQQATYRLHRSKVTTTATTSYQAHGDNESAEQSYTLLKTATRHLGGDVAHIRPGPVMSVRATNPLLPPRNPPSFAPTHSSRISDPAPDRNHIIAHNRATLSDKHILHSLRSKPSFGEPSSHTLPSQPHFEEDSSLTIPPSPTLSYRSSVHFQPPPHTISLSDDYNETDPNSLHLLTPETPFQYRRRSRGASFASYDNQSSVDEAHYLWTPVASTSGHDTSLNTTVFSRATTSDILSNRAPRLKSSAEARSPLARVEPEATPSPSHLKTKRSWLSAFAGLSLVRRVSKKVGVTGLIKNLRINVRLGRSKRTASPKTDVKADRVTDVTEHSRPLRSLRDISHEIKNLSEHPIGGGGYSDLYLGEWRGSEKVALKRVRFFGPTGPDMDLTRRRFQHEVNLWADFKHPRILELYGICSRGTRDLFMVTPFLKHGTILEYLSNTDPNANRISLLAQAAEGLLYLHSCHPSVVHGDMKASNILITDAKTAVLADFGLSKLSTETTTIMLQGVGSPRWMAPELVMARGHDVRPVKTQKSDIYAFGHVMLEVLGNKLPFFHLKEEVYVLLELINEGRSLRPDGLVADVWLTDSAWELSRQCTAVDPNARPDMDFVASQLHRLRGD